MSSGSETRARTKHLTVRLTSEERAAVDRAAEHASLTVGSYVRQALLGAPAPREVRRKPADRRELARLLGAIGHVGANLNQLALHANMGVIVYGNEIDQALVELKQVRDAIMVALGREP